jgi:hypothetical protein
MTFKTIKEALVNPELVTKLSFRVSNSTAVADKESDSCLNLRFSTCFSKQESQR